MKKRQESWSSVIPEWLIHSENFYLVITNTEGDFVFANEHYRNVLSSSPEELSQLNFGDLISADEVEQLMECMQNCVQNGSGNSTRLITKTKVRDTNRFKSIKWECSLIQNSENEPPLILHVGHDVVVVEKESVSEDHFDKSLNYLFDDLQIGVVVQDQDSAILLSNSKAEEFLGLTKDQLYGRTVYDKEWKIINSDEKPFPADDLPAARAIATKTHIRDVVMGVFNPRENRYVWFQVDANPQLDNEGNLIRVVTTFIDITQKVKQEKILVDALKEKTTLLSEIHHRVKNNLAIVSGLLELQSMEVSVELKLPLQRSINRIHSIAMVHELMYQTEKLSSVNIKNYLDQLIPAIQRTMQTKNDVTINLDLEDYQLNINQAIPLGLLMNELLTNSFKYAFLKIFDGKIDIQMKVDGNTLKFIYRDNGPGFKNEQGFTNSPTLGLSLIHAQLDQLHADYTVDTKGKFDLQFSFDISDKGPHSNI